MGSEEDNSALGDWNVLDFLDLRNWGRESTGQSKLSEKFLGVWCLEQGHEVDVRVLSANHWRHLNMLILVQVSCTLHPRLRACDFPWMDCGGGSGGFGC